MEKIAKEEIKEMAKDIAAVVAEDLQSQFKVFGEQLSDVEKKVDGLTEKVDLLTEDMDFVKGEVVEIRKRFKETDEDLVKKADKTVTDDHETRIIKLENTALAEA
jgi:hypothetical protein